MIDKKDGQRITIRPDKELEEAIIRVANRNRISKSALIRQILANAVLGNDDQLEIAK